MPFRTHGTRGFALQNLLGSARVIENPIGRAQVALCLLGDGARLTMRLLGRLLRSLRRLGGQSSGVGHLFVRERNAALSPFGCLLGVGPQLLGLRTHLGINRGHPLVGLLPSLLALTLDLLLQAAPSLLGKSVYLLLGFALRLTQALLALLSSGSGCLGLAIGLPRLHERVLFGLLRSGNRFLGTRESRFHRVRTAGQSLSDGHARPARGICHDLPGRFRATAGSGEQLRQRPRAITW